MARVQDFSSATFFLYLIPFIQPCLVTSQPTGLSLKLIPPDSPDSPFYHGNLSFHERVARNSKTTEARIISLTQNANIQPNIAGQVSGDVIYYVVQVGIGTPIKNSFLIMDTGGGLIWTQCTPCSPCFPQQGPLYDPSKSHTYRKLPLDDPLCKSLYGQSQGMCVYNVSYGPSNMPRVSGTVSKEIFFFGPGRRTPIPTVDNIVFGCTTSSQGFNVGWRNKFSGILGMNLSPDSLPVQLQKLGVVPDGRFSYCLPGYNRNSYLRFGSDIQVPAGVGRTYFIPHGDTYYYGLSLIDISVAGRRMNYKPGTFELRGDHKSGVIIDSGAPYTSIFQEAYPRLLQAFIDYFASFRLQRLPRCREFELCYMANKNFTKYPSMTFHFLGADLVFRPNNVVEFDDNGKKFYLAIKSSEQMTVVGAWQQYNIRFIYDIEQKALSFAPVDCFLDRIY